MTTAFSSSDFASTYVSKHRDGEYMPPLRPGQISVHDGDVTTRVYDLNGFGKGAGKAFELWWHSLDLELGSSCEPTFTYAKSSSRSREEFTRMFLALYATDQDDREQAVMGLEQAFKARGDSCRCEESSEEVQAYDAPLWKRIWEFVHRRKPPPC